MKYHYPGLGKLAISIYYNGHYFALHVRARELIRINWSWPSHVEQWGVDSVCVWPNM